METIEQLFEEFKKSPSSETYAPLLNKGIHMWELKTNRWVRVARYKSGFSKITVNALTYSCIEPLIVNGIWVTIK